MTERFRLYFSNVWISAERIASAGRPARGRNPGEAAFGLRTEDDGAFFPPTVVTLQEQGRSILESNGYPVDYSEFSAFAKLWVRN